jgi:predicted RNA-binding protein with EMAP domain
LKKCLAKPVFMEILQKIIKAFGKPKYLYLNHEEVQNVQEVNDEDCLAMVYDDEYVYINFLIQAQDVQITLKMNMNISANILKKIQKIQCP